MSKFESLVNRLNIHTIGLAALFCVLLFPREAKAQYFYGVYNYYSAGIKGGYEVFTYHMDADRNVQHIIEPNYSYGLSGAYYYRYWLEFHLDMKYARRDLSVKWLYPADPGGHVAEQSLYKIAYLSFPMEVRANFVYLRYLKMNAGLGLMPEFRLRPREIVTYQNGDVQESFDDYLNKDFRRVLFGFPMSLHAQFNFNRHFNARLSAYYYHYVVRMNSYLMDKPGKGFGLYLGFFYDW